MRRLREGVELAGRYVLVKLLRSGGSADVWQALDRQRDVQVALKFSRTGSTAVLSAEFENLRTLSHPAIVKTRDLATDNGLPLLVLDLIDGIELSQYMGADYTVWLPMLRQVVDALIHAHGRGVVHGDIKLENMLATGDGSVVLIDFSDRPGLTAADDIRALAGVISELATGLPKPDFQSARLPGQLASLLTQLAESDTGSVSLGVVATRIDDVLNDGMKSGETEQFERIEPVARQAAVTASRQTAAAPRGPFRWSLLVAGAIAIAVVSTVLYWPRIFPSTGTVEIATDRVDDARARLENLTRQTQEQSAAVYQKWLTLETMNVSTWAELRAQRALTLLQDGETQASEMKHVSALRLLAESDEIFDALLEQAPGIAADRREAGWQAYRSGDAQTAAEHFRVALAIEPDDDEVREALNRTAYLEQITALTRRARELEKGGDLSGALDAMNEAFRIDSDNEDVELEVTRLQSALQAASFQKTMSDVYAALEAGNHDAARGFLRDASSLRPGAAEVRDATTQLELVQRSAIIANIRARAIAAEKNDDWETAIELYSELLRIDPVLVLAQQGRDRSRRVASLAAQAETLLAGSLIKDDARRRAGTLLEQIGTVEAHSPSLRSLESRLTEAVRLSRVPVAVRLESDNLTEIQVYRVARLGVFESHELELMPGEYTVVGTRPGYRDVRTELVVEAGKAPTPLVIRCEEQI